MLQLLLLYLGIGSGFAIGTLAWPPMRRTIDRTGVRLGMGAICARGIWAMSTIIAWPVGLYVRATGRLLLADDIMMRPASTGDRTSNS